MLPSAFVVLERLPLTPNGKVDRQALPAPESPTSSAQDEVLPRTETERLLAHIWQQVLGVERVGLHDNFFALGGDSILSLQIVSQAHQSGLHITPKQLFQHQTIAELVVVASTAPKIEAEQGLVMGAVPLTPIQYWFLNQEQPDAHHWNQALLLTSQQRLDPTKLQQAVAYLLEHHDALRLRFVEHSDDWQQTNAAVDAQIPFEIVNLSMLAPEKQRVTIETVAREKQANLNLENGPIIQVVYFDLGAEQPSRLLIVIHHLAVDGVSWRILLQDLQTAYEQLMRSEPVQLGAKTVSFQQWAQRLAEYAQMPEVRQELPYWLAQVEHQVLPLPIDYSIGKNTVASAHTITVTLDKEETQSLLHEVPAAYRTQINDVLLTALAQAFMHWTGQHSLKLYLEGHGREDISDGSDVSRTVGWFTCLYPCVLDLGESTKTEDALKTIKEQLRAVPHHGIGYGLLRYLCETGEEQLEPLWTMPGAEVSFNYLGQFDQVLAEDTLFRLASEDCGPMRSPQGNRQHLLDINGIISDGQLRISWTYSQNIHRHETIQMLAKKFLQALRTLISHCQLPEVGGYTPSDFPLTRLTQAQIDSVLGYDRAVETVYPLSPLQHGLLFHTLYAPEEGDYITQVGCTLQGELDVEAFKRAWQQVVERYSVLRTSFVWEGLHDPVQVVYRQVQVPFVQYDWREYPAVEQQARLAAYLQEERKKGFILEIAPLMRLLLIRVADDTYEFTWTHHHILLDGWSLPSVIRDVFAYYRSLKRGQTLRLQTVPIYRDYIDWLQQQELGQAEAFWRHALAGFTAPTPLGIDRAVGTAIAERRYDEQILSLPGTTTQALQSLAREHQLTLNTMMQGAWAFLLSRYSGQDDVVFGTTVSGRSASVKGIESMVGLFINTLPVRARLTPEQAMLPWLQMQQAQQTEMRQYEYSPLVQIQGWSEVPRNLPLFESLLVFENYFIGNSVQEEPDLAVKAVRSVEQTSYPLTIVCIPGEQLRLKLLYDCSRFEAEAISQMLEHVEALLESMITNIMIPLASVILENPPPPCSSKTLPAAVTDFVPTEQVFVAARTPVEQKLANIWKEVLGVQQVGIHDNFFNIGGHSLLATQAISQVRTLFEINLPLRKLFDQPTIAELAEFIEKERQEQQSSKPSVPVLKVASREAYRMKQSKLDGTQRLEA